ncbi:MAG: SLBB domain-containing protein [Actinobacteria bacterium]|nr:SLBB domain-containing protein [Actinomycetota bacterium]
MGRLLQDDPVTDLDAYLLEGGGEGLNAATDRAPSDVIDEVDAAGLRGRGGAGFPTGRKWRSVVDAADEDGSPVYLVANGAEGEPGTYKDRVLIERNPFVFLEGLLIARHAVGAQRAFVGIKRKFTRPLQRLSDALDQVQEAGWPGAERVEIVPGPDAYLYGEEKAMLEVIEGKLPLPRILPPYQTGLFATTSQANPTVVNNIESFAHVATILRHGADWFREVGTDSSPGTMIFTVTGDVGAPGVHELPLGTTLRELLDIADVGDVLAIYSGTSNTVITPEMVDTPLGFDEMAAIDTGLGSGGFVVYDTGRCIVKITATLSRFLAMESCGQCLACKLGTAEITELLEKVDRGEGTATDLEEILKRCASVTDQNRCYLPVGEQLMVASTVEQFQDAFVAHLGEPCPSEEDVPIPLIDDIDEDTGDVIWSEHLGLDAVTGG